MKKCQNNLPTVNNSFLSLESIQVLFHLPFKVHILQIVLNELRLWQIISSFSKLHVKVNAIPSNRNGFLTLFPPGKLLILQGMLQILSSVLLLFLFLTIQQKYFFPPMQLPLDVSKLNMSFYDHVFTSFPYQIKNYLRVILSY